MTERDIVRNLLRRARLSQRPQLMLYLAARMLHRVTGIRLARTFNVPVGPLRFAGDIGGMSGLVFLDQILDQRIYDFPGIQADSVIFDVGANCGFFALVYCLENPGATAHCFEPHPRTFEKLAANIRLNGLERRIYATQAAVGSAPGNCEIEVSDASSMAVVAGSGHLVDSAGVRMATKRMSVPLVTLDQYAREKKTKPDLLKIDVEGFEPEVLRGATECLASANSAIVEVDTETVADDCMVLLKKSGFSVTRRDTILFARRGIQPSVSRSV